MISSNSTWDRSSRKPDVSPAFSLRRAKVTFEFPNRQSQKIFSHTLGNITFSGGSELSLTESRNSLISETIGQKDVGGYRYKPVSHTYIKPTLLDTDLTVLAHGSPRSGGYENCEVISAQCAEGTPDKCEAGKCEIGRLIRVAGEKWRYDSLTVPGLYYFVYGTESVRLKTVSRGTFVLPAGVGEVSVNVPASINCDVYLPLNTYSAETFTRRVISDLSANTVTDSVDNFVRALLGRNQAEVKVEAEVRDRLLDSLRGSTIPDWHTPIESVIASIWSKKYEEDDLTNRGFAIEAYEELSVLYGQGLQVAMSGLKVAKVNPDLEIGRPIYGRLPGISGAYNDQDNPDNPARWLTSGADSELSRSKTLIDTFYRVFLNPDTCYPLNLDWIAQHMGFIGGLWDLEWSAAIKRTLLSNAHVNRLPDSLPWTTNPVLDTLRGIDFSKIERVSVSGSEVTLSYRYSSKIYNSETSLTEVETSNDLIIDMSRWQGILPGRGNKLTLLFMFWAFGIKAPSPEEMKYESDDSTFVVKSGLRENEASAPINTPYMVDVLRVGDDTDAEVGNFPNQLIADISTTQDELSANTMIVRMPFYYNRDGRSWDAARQVLENYAPETSIKRIQYAYSVADLLVAEDVFFEPVVE